MPGIFGYQYLVGIRRKRQIEFISLLTPNGRKKEHCYCCHPAGYIIYYSVNHSCNLVLGLHAIFVVLGVIKSIPRIYDLFVGNGKVLMARAYIVAQLLVIVDLRHT